MIFEPMSQWTPMIIMCIPGRDTQNTEAPRKTWQLRGTDFVGLYFKVSTDPKYKRKKIRMKLLIWNCFWQVSSQTTALTGQGYQFCYDHRSDPNVSQNVCLPLRLWVLIWNILLIQNCTRLDRPRVHWHITMYNHRSVIWFIRPYQGIHISQNSDRSRISVVY